MASSSRGAQQDQFIDYDEEDLTCPLCVEEFDLSDRNFRPCPCGYQVCQFCFNNIKTNMNGLCPACRRPYDEKTIEWKVVTPEEIAAFKAKAAKEAKKKQEQRQKDAQKREVENLNRKHLAGLRVVQKNLVYVVGLQPGIKETELLQTLRGDKYFGQYGQILKIVVSKPKSSDPNPNPNAPIGVYVTFARKEDATRCIQAVNGSTNLGTVLRAQLGTTKYCSAYLRNETCTNKQCMFLHEPGDNEDSYSRQDLSSLRGEATQKPLPITSTSSRQAAQAQTPSQSIQPVAAASQPMGREASKDGSDSGDGSALPSTASWGSRPFQQQSRRGSVAASLAASSPAVSTALPTHVLEPAEPVREAPEEPAQQASAEPAEPTPPVVSALDAFLSDKSPEYVRLFKAVRFMKFNPTPIPGAEDFPPLFDPYGGLKRRAWREQQEETRLHVEPELQTDMQSISDAVEDEPESGSGQLGGEPEERSDDRESLSQSGFLDQRRLSSQQPIQQRAGHDGSSFGGSPNQNFAPGLSNLSSINARNLTPLQQQQLMLLKSGQTGQAQGGFMEQLPPGLAGTSQSTLFQQPGHNRQASRYAFANENVKSASAAKIGGMQSSMMPAQPGQFYGTSMPGPPPGLKSTGTPPMGSGGMFGQSHGFGGALGGNAAFGAAKDSNSEMLREMLRNRGGMASGGQIHDAAKRESMFPSFLHQYPSASTPAPAPGLAASLYGTQPGAFQDFGKQKKKGKKHRHANTSSSGGGGLVDLADPMFQARMPLQQQQSNAGAGQGLFGGHGQEDPELPELEEASFSVDALVADSTADHPLPHHGIFDFERVSRSSTPAVPPGFSVPALNSPGISRSSTPALPPGLALPHGHPSPSLKHVLTSKTSRVVTGSSSFSPSKAQPAAHIPRVATPLTVPSTPTMAAASSSASVSATAAPAVPAAQPKPDQKTVPASVAATPIASAAATPVKSAPQEPKAPATPASTSSILKPDDFPVLEKGKEKVVPPTAPKAMAATPKKGPSTAATSATEPLAATKAVKQKPVKLSLATPAPASVPVPVPAPALTQASTPAVEKAPVTIDVAPKSVINAAAFPALPPSTAASPVVSSPAIRTAPKTLRVVPAAKVEAAAAPVVSLPLSAAALPSPSLSKQPSIVSLSRTDRPSTPASELISDNASLTSASLSRPSSPPPTRVGSAPVRTKTKSQLKKERKEAGKEKVISEAESSSAKPEPEVEIAPIMGRKKKQKKEKPASSKTSTSTPAISRAASPSPAPEAKEVEKPPVEKAVEVISTKQNKEVEPEAKIGKTSDPKSKGKGKTAEAPSPVEPPATPELPEEPAEKPLPTPQQVLSELMAEALVPDVNKLAFVRPPVITVPRVDLTTGDLQPMEAKLEITDEDREALNAGRPVRKLEPKGATRVMLTPNGDCVRNLTPAEEERYLELQRTILEEYGPASFVPSRHNATTGFTLIQGRAVPNGPPAFFPLVDTNGSVMDPVSKIQRDEALSYINQFVLPSLSTNPQLERALNANVIDADMLSGARSGAQQWWKPAPTTGGDHSVGQLDPLENLTAAAAARAGTAVNTGVTVANGGAAPGQPAPLGNVTLLSLQDSEVAMQAAKKETEKIERALNQLLKKNRRLLLGATGGH